MNVVRFAPSPTGYLHLGSGRTALFNWLFARSTGGRFILRVEDTDKERSKKEFLEEILESLKWMGLNWDGEPVYQSDRFDIYKKKAETLLKLGKAYKEGEAVIYKVEKGRIIEIDDMIHGKIMFSTDEIKDQVMIKSDGSPAYNFCCVIDDAELGITHIIRGDDHISNTPKQVLFYEALGITPPGFAHMPLMMGADGSKLSKRHGAVSVREYRQAGFLPEALSNYLLLLGWNPGNGKEIFSLEETIKIFKIGDISNTQARFDMQKLEWMNGEYIMSLDRKKLSTLLNTKLEEEGVSLKNIDNERFEELVSLYQVRLKKLSAFYPLTDWFFTDDYSVEEKGKRKYLDPEENKKNLREFADKLEGLEDFSRENIEAVCREIVERRSLKASGIIHPARMAISGKTIGAGLFELMHVLGKKKVLERMRNAAE